MERSRFITVALIALNLSTIAHISAVKGFSLSWIAILVFTSVFVHLISTYCYRFKSIHAISPLISFGLLVFTLLAVNTQGDHENKSTSFASFFDMYFSVRDGIELLKSDSNVELVIPILLVFVLITWCVAEIGETLAQRLHSSAPTLVWYVLINALIYAQEGSFYPAIIIALCGSIWFYLYSFNWTHEHAKAHKISIPSASRVNNYLTYSVSFIVVIALSLALAIPNISLPSLAPKNLFSFLNPAPPQAELSPFVGLRDLLNSPTDDVLFTASATQSQYFRVNVLNVFTEETWRASDEVESPPETIPQGVQTTSVEAKVKLESLSNSLLPTFYSLDSLSTDQVRLLENNIVASEESSLREYSFTANVPPLTLTADQIAASSAEPPQSVQSSMLIPASFDEEIINQAVEIATGKDSIYSQAIALRDFFLDGSFTYDINVDYTSDVDAMKTFLEQRRGYCEQFAATYAAMARSIGIPARVVIGFNPGEPDEFGNFTITSYQAHAWVEVYLSNFGWLTIDPTPPGPLPGQAPDNIGNEFTTTTTTIPTTVPNSQPNSSVTTAAQREFEPANESQSSNLVPLAMLAVFGLTVGGAGIYARKKYWEQDKNITGFVLSSYRQVARKVIKSDPDPSMTIKELSKLVPKENKPITDFLDLLEEASYKPNSEIDLAKLKQAAEKAKAEKITSTT